MEMVLFEMINVLIYQLALKEQSLFNHRLNMSQVSTQLCLGTAEKGRVALHRVVK